QSTSVAAQEYSWTGLYIGAHAGWANRDIDGEYITPPPDHFDGSNSTFSGGGLFGYQRQYDNWLFGVEGAYTYLDASYATRGSPTTSCLAGTPNRICHTRISNMWQAGGRVGVLVAPEWALLGSLGYASADLDTFSSNATTGTVITETGERHGGWYI